MDDGHAAQLEQGREVVLGRAEYLELRFGRRDREAQLGRAIDDFSSAANKLDRLAGRLDSLRATLQSVAGLEGYRGHLFNWYDTRSGQPLEPR